MGENEKQTVPQEPMYVDRSAQLRATLNSLAMMNVANLLANKKKQNTSSEIDEILDEQIPEIEHEYQLDEDATIKAILEDFDEE